MSLIGVDTPTLGACDNAGGAVKRRTAAGTAEAFVPQWKAGAWTSGQLVMDRAAATDPWTIYLATAAHGGTDASPSSGASGWLALSAAPTRIDPWAPGTTYPTGTPVRIDGGPGLARIFIADKPVPNSANSPDSAAGIAEGWHEISVVHPPPATLYDAAKTYRVGDMCQEPLGTVWVATGPIGSAESPGSAGADWVKVSA